MNLISKRYFELCEEAMKAYGDVDPERSFEESLLNILDFIKSHPTERSVFVELLKKTMHSKDLPLEAVSFCMRELRWPEIKVYVIQCMNESRDPRSEALRSIYLAYDKDWPDSDLYDYFNH